MSTTTCLLDDSLSAPADSEFLSSLPGWKWFTFDKGQYCAANRLFSPRPAVSLLLSWRLQFLTLCLWEYPYQGFHNKLLPLLQDWLAETSNQLSPCSLCPMIYPECALIWKVRITGLITCWILSLSYPVLRGAQDASEFFSLFLIKISVWNKNSETCLSICSPNFVWAVASFHSATV